MTDAIDITTEMLYALNATCDCDSDSPDGLEHGADCLLRILAVGATEIARLRASLADAEAREKRARVEGRIEAFEEAAQHAAGQSKRWSGQTSPGAHYDRVEECVRLQTTLADMADRERAALAEPEAEEDSNA